MCIESCNRTSHIYYSVSTNPLICHEFKQTNDLGKHREATIPEHMQRCNSSGVKLKERRKNNLKNEGESRSIRASRHSRNHRDKKSKKQEK